LKHLFRLSFPLLIKSVIHQTNFYLSLLLFFIFLPLQELKGEREELIDALNATRRELDKTKQELQQKRRSRGDEAELDGDVIDNPVDAELRRAKNRITLLETEISMWEQRFLNEVRETRAQ
jgi:hypothetical protein